MSKKHRLWCNKCSKHHDNYKILRVNKGKKGRYYPYRDTMDSEICTYTEVILECLVCTEKTRIEEDQRYEMSKTNEEIYGHRGSNYGT